MVKKGQLLATIDPRPFEIALQQAIGARMRDEAQLENGAGAAAALPDPARPGLDRAPGRRHPGGAGQAARGDARRSTAPTRTPRASTSATPGSSRRSPAGSACAPIDVGNYIGAGDATGVARDHPARADRRRVLGAAGPRARDPGERRPRRAARRRRAGPHPHAQARRRHASRRSTTRSTSQTGTVKAKARFANAGEQPVPEPVRQRAPAAALGRRRGRRAGDGAAPGPNGDFVYVLNDDRTVSVRAGAARRRDQRGDRRSPRGLEAGERVVTEGGDRLRDGARVQLASERPAAARAAAASGAFGGRRGASGARCRRPASGARTPMAAERPRRGAERAR